MNLFNNKENPSWFSQIVRAIVVLLLTGVFAYKIITTPFNLAMDFYALLSLLLALFSVGLSVLFYFKATETSNAFYDNTYKFTKDIAELLVRIESGFGERLKHLDENYMRMQDKVFPVSKEEESKTKDELKIEEENFQKIIQERNKVIDDLLAKTNLADKEKNKFIKELDKREEDLQAARREIEFLKERVEDFAAPISENKKRKILTQVNHHLVEYVFPRMHISDFKKVPRSKIAVEWRGIADSINDAFLDDLKYLGFVDGNNNLTANGVMHFRKL